MSPKVFAHRLVDNVSCATQLDTEKGELPNVDDWRRNAMSLAIVFRKEVLEEAAVMFDRGARIGRVLNRSRDGQEMQQWCEWAAGNIRDLIEQGPADMGGEE